MRLRTSDDCSRPEDFCVLAVTFYVSLVSLVHIHKITNVFIDKDNKYWANSLLAIEVRLPGGLSSEVVEGLGQRSAIRLETTIAIIDLIM